MLLRRMTDRYRWVLRAVIVIILATMLAIMGLQIVCRYVFNASLIWAEEMCRYLLIWVSFLAIVDAYERGEIAAVTMLRDSLPRRASILLTMVVEGLGIALMVTLVIYGLRYAEMIGYEPIPAITFLFADLFGAAAPVAPTTFWVYAALPIGLGMVAARLAVDLVANARRLVGKGAGEGAQ